MSTTVTREAVRDQIAAIEERVKDSNEVILYCI